MEDKFYNHFEWFPRLESKLGIEENAICILATIGNGSSIGMTQMLIKAMSYTDLPKYEILEYLNLLIDRGHVKIIFQPPSPEDWRYIATKKGELKLIELKNNFDKKLTTESKPIKGRRKHSDKTTLDLIDIGFLHFYNQEPITPENKIAYSEKYNYSPDSIYNKYTYVVKHIVCEGSSGNKKEDKKRIDRYTRLIPKIKLQKNKNSAKNALKKLNKIYTTKIEQEDYDN